MGKLCIAKRGNTYQYKFEIASLGEKRKFITKCGFRSKDEAIKQGTIAYNEYLQTGHNFTPNDMSFSDYLDYWFKEHCEINLKYHTIQAYRNITENHIKPNIGFYRLSQLTTSTIQEFINRIYVEKSFSKNFLKNILKVLKGSLGYATDVVGFIKVNPALKVKMPKYDMPEEDPAHIFSKEEIEDLKYELDEKDTIIERLEKEVEKFKGKSSRISGKALLEDFKKRLDMTKVRDTKILLKSYMKMMLYLKEIKKL